MSGLSNLIKMLNYGRPKNLLPTALDSGSLPPVQMRPSVSVGALPEPANLNVKPPSMLSPTTIIAHTEDTKSARVPFSLRETFGSFEMNTLYDLGHTMHEKPDYFSDIKDTIGSRDIKEIEEAVGYKLNSYNIDDVLSPSVFKGQLIKHPQNDLKPEALKYNDQMFILWDPKTKDRYLVDRTGAKKYIRHWTKIKD